MRTIYLIRHGHPYFPSEEKMCIGKCDLSLSQEGARQAMSISQYLRGKPLTALFSSPLRRSLQTAQWIAQTGLAIHIVQEMEELDVGDWDGLTFTEIKRQYPERYALRATHPELPPTNGESYEHGLARAKQTFTRLVDHTQGDIAIVSHTGVNCLLLCDLMQKPIRQMREIPQPYGCINVIHYGARGFSVVGVGVIP